MNDLIPEGFLSRVDCATSPELLNKWLTRFVLEGTRKQDESFYPTETVYHLLCGIYRHMVGLFGAASVPNFMAKKNPLFAVLNAVTDKHYRMLRQVEVGSMCTLGVLGSHTPNQHLWPAH